ncbi:hypothetical protein E2C01_083461 [Portunus trituberculatus]|uniref:Uncharacterized protein n=1 Tax=Portunus trituberculatus TaxID=210409 RepID=A0A5B7IXA3_PORTR|nr:hypothetical protein [Portunus trituberculatus]
MKHPEPLPRPALNFQVGNCFLAVNLDFSLSDSSMVLAD